MKKRLQSRDEKIYEAYTKSGLTLEEIGKIYGLTKERIRQIVELKRSKHLTK